VADISKRFKRRVQPRVTLDRELIGGVHVTVGDEVIDGSVRGKLADMAAALKS
jgi:F-type H+-transporting ATPase subunit delta